MPERYLADAMGLQVAHSKGLAVSTELQICLVPSRMPRQWRTLRTQRQQMARALALTPYTLATSSTSPG